MRGENDKTVAGVLDQRRLLVRAAVGFAAAGVLAVTVAGSSWGSTTPTGPYSPVIVHGKPGTEARVDAAIRKLGGKVERRLGIINGFSARVPQGSIPRLRQMSGVMSVTPNAPLRAQGATYDPNDDPHSMESTAEFLGADRWWGDGYTGKGVDVAVIDSGVSPVTGLSSAGKVAHGPDLSLESQAPNLTRLDTYGHGTFMAGLIAANDKSYRGMAPGARIVSVKVATADGGTDVSQVIAGIDWVVQHAHDPGFNIRVLNLSYGTNSTQPYAVDPLAFAAEQAWKRGIVVVASAGNTGYQLGTGAPGLADPAYDPYLIAVGASVPTGSHPDDDDEVADFSASSACSQSCRGPDFLAPGMSLQGLRVTNSWIDVHHPEGVIGSRFFRGSGTSQAAAITSGAVALVLQRYPSMTPDVVKKFFRNSAVRIDNVSSGAQGDGQIWLKEMLDANPPSSSVQTHIQAVGGGSLELSRGSDHITRDGVVLSGEKDIFGKPVNTAALAHAEANGSSWSGGAWNGSSWSGSSWSGSSWSGSSWSGSSWSGSSWSGSSWSGSSWSGSSWSGSSWSGSSWSGSSWSGSSWSSYWG